MVGKKIVVFGYNAVGHACLQLLLERGERVAAVITHEDNPNETIWFDSVAQLARQNNIPVLTPSETNSNAMLTYLKTISPDLIFSFYYRNLIASQLLNVAKLGAFNMHGSLLPKYRGRVPINWAIIHGENETGATLHHMVKRPDAGDIVDQQAVSIEPEDTAQAVFLKVTQAAVKVLGRQIDAIKAGRAPRIVQDESQASYFGARRPEDGKINWRLSASDIFNLIRAVTRPYPGAFTMTKNGHKLIVWWARVRSELSGEPGRIINLEPLTIACGRGALELSETQWADSKPADSTQSLTLQLGECCYV